MPGPQHHPRHIQAGTPTNWGHSTPSIYGPTHPTPQTTRPSHTTHTTRTPGGTHTHPGTTQVGVTAGDALPFLIELASWHAAGLSAHAPPPWAGPHGFFFSILPCGAGPWASQSTPHWHPCRTAPPHCTSRPVPTCPTWPGYSSGWRVGVGGVWTSPTAMASPPWPWRSWLPNWRLPLYLWGGRCPAGLNAPPTRPGTWCADVLTPPSPS